MPQNSPVAIDLTGWEKTIRKIAKDLHDGVITTADLDQGYIQATHKELNKASRVGYGSGWRIADSKGIPSGRVIDMKRNLYKFSAAKNTAMLQEINDLLYDGDRLRTLNEMRSDLDRLNIKYNDNWLKTEYRTARQSSHTAKQWEAFQHNKELFPNLQYSTQEDDRVRMEHEALNGYTAAIDDPIWNQIAPPNGWNCRCFLRQTAEQVSHIPPDWKKEVSPEFRVNTGKTGQIFNEHSKTGHRFFALAEEIPGWKERFELSKLEGGSERVRTRIGTTVQVNIYADTKDLQNNLQSALLASNQLGLKYQVRPDLKNGWRNPEYFIDDLVADRYAGDVKVGFREKRKQIKTFIKQFNEQFPDKKLNTAYAIHFDISNIRLSYDLARVINGKFKSGKRLQMVVIENKGKTTLLRKTDNYAEMKRKIESIKAKKD